MNTLSTRRAPDGLAALLVLGCCLFWGMQQVLVKATVAEIAPVFQASIRFILATVLLALWCAWRGIPLWRQHAAFGPGVLAGALFAGEFACIYLGLNYTSASRLTLFVYTSPLWVAILLPRFIPGERLRSVQWVGLACAFIGVAIAMADGLWGDSQVQQPQAWIGDLLALAAGLMWGLTTVVIRSTPLGATPPEKQLFYQLVVSALALPVVSLALGETWQWDWSAFAWGSILIQASIGAFASYLVWMWMLAHYMATKLSVFVFLTPVFALCFGAWWLNEPFTLPLLIALALVAIGIVLVNRR